MSALPFLIVFLIGVLAGAVCVILLTDAQVYNREDYVKSCYVEPDVSDLLVSTPYDGRYGLACPDCAAPTGKRHGRWCPVND